MLPSSLAKAAAVAGVLLVLASAPAAAQQPILVGAGEEVPSGEFALDLRTGPSAYAGDYHFGDSESESTLTLTIRGGSVTGRLSYSTWDDAKGTFVGDEVRLEGGRIVGAVLMAPGWSGVFVRYSGRPGLVIFRAPDDVLKTEFGRKLDQ